MGRFTISLNEFTPAEAEYITALPQATKRDWVRRRILPKTAGHARSNVRDLAEMFMLRLLSEHNLGPDRFKPAAMLAAQGLLYYALRLSDHYEGTFDALEQFCVLENEPQVKLLRKLGYTGERLKKYMIVWADQSVTFTEDLNEAFGVLRENSGKDFIHQEGPVLVFSLQMLGVKFKGLDHKPFVRVAFAEGSHPWDLTTVPAAKQLASTMAPESAVKKTKKSKGGRK